MATDTAPVRNDALARATTLANRARDLRRAQSEVQELTSREVQVLARTAASFFDSTPLPEFTATLLPHSARGLRRIRHRILHRTIHNGDAGMLIRALLLGKDGNLRLFSARSADARDLMLIMEPGRSLPAGVVRDVVDWTPTLRIPGFRPFEILDKLSHSLDAVEEQIADAEHRVQVQKAALASGDLTALLPAVPAESESAAMSPSEASETPALPAPPRRAIASVSETPLEPALPMAAAPEEVHAEEVHAEEVSTHDPFNMFDKVEAVAAAAEVHEVATKSATKSATHVPVPEPDEWDNPAEPRSTAPMQPKSRGPFPPMPSPR
jgi:hypothetical protein